RLRARLPARLPGRLGPGGGARRLDRRRHGRARGVHPGRARRRRAVTEAAVRSRDAASSRERAALGLLIGGLGAAVVLRTTVVPRRWHLAYNLGIGTFSVLVARAGGLGAGDLGLASARVGDGLRWGGAAFGAVTLAGTVGALAGLLSDDHTDVTADEMLWQIGVAIPLGTVVVEELAFRGALHGLLERVTTPTRA